MMKNIDKNGFTLIELVIAVAIFAIIVAIAVPSYQKYLRDSAMRTAGQTMLKDAQFMEKYKEICGNYAADSTNTSIPRCFSSSSNSSNVAWTTLPYQVSPESGTALYQIEFSSEKPDTADSSDFNSFRLIAYPVKGTIVENSKCVCVDQDNNVLYGVTSCNGVPKDKCTTGVDGVNIITPAPVASGNPTPPSEPTPSTAPTPSVEPSTSPSPTGVLCSSYGSWSSGTAYTGGSMVSYNGFVYKANWWTQGNNPATNNGGPGTGEEWLKIETCQ